MDIDEKNDGELEVSLMAYKKAEHKRTRAVARPIAKKSKINIFKGGFTKIKYSYKRWQIFASIALVGLLLFTLGSFLYNVKMSANRIIVKHINEISTVFNAINEKCGILSFEHKVNYVDFLTVGSFESSEVGGMNLRNKDSWEGPYFLDNPTVQAKHYEIIKTKKGYFLVPGNGVKLSSGLVIGKDVVFDKDTDVDALVENGTLVDKSGNPLVAEIPMAR